jgi:hypothetical protein
MPHTERIQLAPSHHQICSDKSGYSQLVDFYLRCQKHSDCVIFIDFEGLRWIDANMCALFDAILFKLNMENGLRFSLDIELIQSRFDILFRNGFLRDIGHIENYTKSAVELNTFAINEDQRFYEFIDQQLLSHDSLQISDETKEGLTRCFLEVFTNVESHASTTLPVFACGQYYPTKGQLTFTLLDLGIGYSPKIQEHTNGRVNSSKGAVKWAIQEGHSTKKDARGGDGLSEIVKYCRANKGALHIVTGDAYWGSNLGAVETFKVKRFAGSMLNITFNC